jgi:phenylacetate-CoA ligase
MNRRRFSAFDVSETRMADWMRRIRRIRPLLLYGYPSVLHRFACFVERSGESLRVPFVGSSSERLYDYRREKIASVFGCPVADEYGAAEVSIIGAECPRGSMHATMENLIIEVVDAEGRPLAEGESGELVVTDLRNVAMPLLRYRLGDTVRRVSGPCPCGRGLERIEIQEGTKFGELELPSGRVVNAVAFHFVAEPVLARAAGRIRDLRVVRRAQGLRLEVVAGPGSEAAIDELLEGLRRATGGELEVEASPVDQIDRTGSDKFRIFFED